MGGPLSFQGWCLARFADHIDLRAAVIALIDQFMARLHAKMGHVDNGGGIICQHAQDLARRHGFQPFAGFQDGKGAQQARGIQSISQVSHPADLMKNRDERNQIFPPPMPRVSTRPQGCDLSGA